MYYRASLVSATVAAAAAVAAVAAVNNTWFYNADTQITKALYTDKNERQFCEVLSRRGHVDIRGEQLY